MTVARIGMRQRGDFVLLLLFVGAALCLPLGVQVSRWVPDGGRLIYVVLWAAVAGAALARSPLPSWLGWLVGIVLGMEYALQFAGGVLPSLGVLWNDLGQAFGWLWRLLWDRVVVQPVPFTVSGQHIATRTAALVGNAVSWWASVQAGTPTTDNTMLWLGSSFLVWLLTCFGSFDLYRYRRPFLALLPLGVAVVTNVSFTDIGMAYVQVFLAFTVLTLLWANVGRMESVWTRLGLDFSPELRRDALVAGFGISTVVLVVALLVPYTTFDDAVWFFWDRYGEGLQGFYTKLDKAFAGRNPVPSPTPSKRGVAPHDIRGGARPDEKTVLLVRTSDPPPPSEQQLLALGIELSDAMVAKHYWRERTYDLYTGHGWDSSGRNSQLLGPAEPWFEPGYPHTVLTQTYELVERRELAFAVNEPRSADAEYRVFTRGVGDFAGFSTGALTYTVVSWVPDATIDELRGAEDEYPDWVSQRYLTLPEIPQRVRDRAAQVVAEANASTRYDKAKALEAHLRTLVYDADLAPPPLDADVVDYFLFTAQRGYCDYSATALAVMLRSVGVAARYASGYGMGYYDDAANAWVVLQTNSHAWTEVYFPGYGWLEFEPTPTQRVFTRYTSRGAQAAALQPTPVSTARPALPPLWLASGGLLVVLLFVIIWPPRWFRRARLPRDVVWRAYGQLIRGGRWIGLSPEGGQTPREYLALLADEVVRRTAAALDPRRDIDTIRRAYERARYSEELVTSEDGSRAEAAWRRIRGLLLRSFFVRGPRQPSQGA